MNVTATSWSTPAVQLGALALAELLAMTLWFSATAVLPSLSEAWSLSSSSAAWMTASVQLGFVVGALGFLAPGPALGCLAMWALRRRPDAIRMAAGRR